VISDGAIAWRAPVAEVQDHAGPAVEQARLHVERGPRRTADASGGLGELVVVPVGEVLVEDQANAYAAVSEVRHGPPALVDLHAPVVADQAALEILPQCGPRHVEQRRLAGLLVQVNEKQRRTSAAVHEPGVRVGTTAYLADCVLVPQPVRDRLRHVEGRAAQRRVTGDRGEMRQVEADTGQPAVQVQTEPVPLARQLGSADVEDLQRLGPLSQVVEHVGHAVQAVVEAHPGRPQSRIDSPLQQPFFVFRIVTGAGHVQGVEHSGRPVRDVQAAGPELLDIAGKQPVVAIRGGAGEDGPGQRCADLFPAVSLRVQRKPRMRRPGPRCADDRPHRLVEEGRGNGERLGDHGGEIHRLGPVDRDQGGQREEQEQAKAGQRVTVDVEAGTVPGRGEARSGQGLPARFLDACRYLEVDQYHPAVWPQQDVERV
jgi:hypothetical protein